jgi:TetR/AcrR family transcriptional regulator, transcriptional repressor for nem operon
MARPRKFDREAALEAAMDCFWRRGYKVTSMRELTACMGISGPSLYNTFGDKRAIFAAALERYVNRSPRAHIKHLEGFLPPKESIRRFFDEIIERSLNDPERRGCLLINLALEAPHDREPRSLITDCLAEIEAFFCRSIKAAKKQGRGSNGHHHKRSCAIVAWRRAGHSRAGSVRA